MDTEFFRELERFSLLVKKRVSTTYSGGRKSLRFGHGISPVGYREYRRGDDFKLVDWKVYARTEKLYLREHEEERSLLVQILLDASGSMVYDNKFIYASQIAAGFAYLATMENEKFAISLFCKLFYPGEPKRGRRHLIQTINNLDKLIPKGQANLKKISDQFEAVVRSTSLVVLISDLLGDTENIVSSIYRLSDHELIIIRVLAPNEDDLDFRGDIRFVDMETRQPLISRVTESERIEYKKKLEEHISKINVACNNVGADFFSFRTDKPIFDAFSEMVSKAIVWRA
ncbi:MAG: DUF58 domain-containing protein [Methanotrichaceae archaeon]|nr:DUF58 domain-containing protein [Methanotrichaceae archaeon]